MCQEFCPQEGCVSQHPLPGHMTSTMWAPALLFSLSWSRDSIHVTSNAWWDRSHGTPPGQTPPRYSQWVCSMYSTGMHCCLLCRSFTSFTFAVEKVVYLYNACNNCTQNCSIYILLAILDSHVMYCSWHSGSRVALLCDSLLTVTYDLQVKTYKYVGVNTCHPMSVLLSRLTAVKAHIVFVSLALLWDQNLCCYSS